MHALRRILVMLMALAIFTAAHASESCNSCSSCDTCAPHLSLNVRAIARSTDRNYITDFERVKDAAIEAVEEEAHVSREKIEITEQEGCSCGQVVYLKAPYIDFSHIKVKIDGSGKNSGMPELSVSITTDKTFFTRHKECEQCIHELVLLKLQAKKHGDESHVSSIAKPTHPAATQPAASQPAQLAPPVTPPAK